MKKAKKAMVGFAAMLSAVLSVVSCGGPRIIPDEELAQIFHDVYLTNAYIDQTPGVRFDTLNIYEPIFARYGYTSEDVQYTIGNFAKRKSARLSDDVVDRAVGMLHEQSAFYNNRIAVRDTITGIARRRFASIVYRDSLIRVGRIADTADLRITIPAREGSYEIKYSYMIDSVDGNRNLRTNIYLEDEEGRQSSNNTRRMAYSRRERVLTSLDADSMQRSLVIDLNGYPTRGMTTPSMRIDSLTVTYHLPDRIAVDSISRAHPELGAIYSLMDLLNGRSTTGSE